MEKEYYECQRITDDKMILKRKSLDVYDGVELTARYLEEGVDEMLKISRVKREGYDHDAVFNQACLLILTMDGLLCSHPNSSLV